MWYSKMPLDLLPDIEFPIVAVITEYEGVGPKEIESTVTRPLEESLAGINNIDTITSTSKEGMSMIRVQFVWGTDMSLAVSDIRERVDIVKKFLPDGIETPIVLKFDVSMMPIMVLSVSGSRDPSFLREYAEDNLKNMLEQIDGVASATVVGGQKREVRVELVKNRMEAYDIAIESVVGTVGLENMNVAGATSSPRTASIPSHQGRIRLARRHTKRRGGRQEQHSHIPERRREGLRGPRRAQGDRAAERRERRRDTHEQTVRQKYRHRRAQHNETARGD